MFEAERMVYDVCSTKDAYVILDTDAGNSRSLALPDFLEASGQEKGSGLATTEGLDCICPPRGSADAEKHHAYC